MVVLRPEESGLPQLLERVLDKGIVVSADIRVKICDNELLGVKSTSVIASFRTAAKVGLDFPVGIHLNTPAWRELTLRHHCPLCGMEIEAEIRREEGCPWCGWNRRREGDPIWKLGL